MACTEVVNSHISLTHIHCTHFAITHWQRWAHESKILDKLNQADPFYVKNLVLPISWTGNAMEQLDSVKHNQLKKGQVLVGAADKFGRKLPRMYITGNDYLNLSTTST
jgi:hypothetical protein